MKASSHKWNGAHDAEYKDVHGGLGHQPEHGAHFRGKLMKAYSREWKGFASIRSTNGNGEPREEKNHVVEKSKLIEKYRRFTPAIMHRQLSPVL